VASDNKIMLPLVQFEQIAVFEEGMRTANSDSADLVLKTGREKLYKEAGARLLERLVSIKGKDVLTYADEVWDTVKEGTQDVLILKISVYEVVEKPAGFLKCPACKKIINLGR